MHQDLQTKCIKPIKIDKISQPIGRCGRCKPCRTMKRVEWTNRMTLENYGLEYRPLFVTCSYAPAHLPNNYAECIKFTQKWIKRLRRRLDAPVRYFLCTEEGEKNGRLHQHLIMWIPSISHLNINQQWKILFETWGAGRLECSHVRSSSAFFYTTKYILKNLSSEGNKHEWSRYDGKFVKKGRLYTWSQKPMLGTAGYERWKEITDIWIENYPGQLPPNWFNMVVLGKLQKVYVTRSMYVNHIQKNHGISLSPVQDSKVAPLDITKQELEREITKWLKDEKTEDIQTIQA